MIQLEPFATTSQTFEEMTTRYLSALRTSGSPLDVNRAIVIEEYLHRESKAFVSFVEKQKVQIYETLVKLIPCQLCVYGRKKSLYSYDMKLRQTDDVRSVKDIYAIRVVIDDKLVGVESAITFCYVTAKALIDYYQLKGFTADTLEVKGTGKLEDRISEKIFIPDKKAIPGFMTLYSPVVKDYIANPKLNGYQSIHLRVQKDGRSVDVQVRTSSMEEYNEHGGASHDLVYKTPAPREFVTQLNMDGLKYNQDGLIIDDEHGFLKPLPIGQKLGDL